MLTEELMETLIAEDLYYFLGEEGLEVIERQHRTHNYRFDLLLKDRRGDRLIVEIQKGTLDRKHRAKILDYYDEYKHINPSEFVDVMLVANKIPRESRERLDDKGIAWKEIPEKKFIEHPGFLSSKDKPKIIKQAAENSAGPYGVDSRAQFKLFAIQRNRLFGKICQIDSEAAVMWFVEKYNPNKSNWFAEFIPSVWTEDGKDMGLGYGFQYKEVGEKVLGRFWVRVEKPFQHERQLFKENVISYLKKMNIELVDTNLYPNAGRKGSKLIEAKYAPLEDSADYFFELYQGQDRFREVVADCLRQYRAKGCIPNLRSVQKITKVNLKND